MELKGGYTMIDCKGLNLLSQSAQTISGLYNDCKTAIATGKAVFAHNINFGVGNPMTPVPIMVNFESAESTSIVCTASTIQIWVASNDAVTIVNLAPAN